MRLATSSGLDVEVGSSFDCGGVVIRDALRRSIILEGAEGVEAIGRSVNDKRE